MIYAHDEGKNEVQLCNGDNEAVSIENGGTGAKTAADALLNLGIKNYVVEQGVEGIWNYRKWNNGNVELWGAPSSGELIMAATGNMFRSEPVYFTVPTFMKTIKNVFYNSHSANVIGLANYGSLDPENSIIGIRVQRSTDDGGSVKFSALLIGTWK